MIHPAAAIAGSSVGFLKHNYNPAKIFMGTGGAPEGVLTAAAMVLAFTLAALSAKALMVGRPLASNP